MIIDCHTHFWRYPGELTDELASETFIMRNQKVELNITEEQHKTDTIKADRVIVFGLRAPNCERHGSGIRSDRYKKTNRVCRYLPN